MHDDLLASFEVEAGQAIQLSRLREIEHPSEVVRVDQLLIIVQKKELGGMVRHGSGEADIPHTAVAIESQEVSGGPHPGLPLCNPSRPHDLRDDSHGRSPMTHNLTGPVFSLIGDLLGDTGDHDDDSIAAGREAVQTRQEPWQRWVPSEGSRVVKQGIVIAKHAILDGSVDVERHRDEQVGKMAWRGTGVSNSHRHSPLSVVPRLHR
jgi:hypothetical protein